MLKNSIRFGLSLFLKYFLWFIKISFNIIFFIVLDLPFALFVMARWTYYFIFFFEIYENLEAQLGYWMARYLTAEDWVYDGYNSPEFENHYYQWRFFSLVKHYWKFALSIIFKIVYGWFLSILHFFLWFIYRSIRNWRRILKKGYLNMQFIYWRVSYAVGARINLCINNAFELCSFNGDFLNFDRKGWYTYGRDTFRSIPETMQEGYVPVRFRIKKDATSLSEEQRNMFKKNLNSMREHFQNQFPLKDVKDSVQVYDSRLQNGIITYDFFNKLALVTDQDLLKQKENLLKANTSLSIVGKDGKEKEMTKEQRQDLLKQISKLKVSLQSQKLIAELLAKIKMPIVESNYDGQIKENEYKVSKSLLNKDSVL